MTPDQIVPTSEAAKRAREGVADLEGKPEDIKRSRIKTPLSSNSLPSPPACIVESALRDFLATFDAAALPLDESTLAIGLAQFQFENARKEGTGVAFGKIFTTLCSITRENLPEPLRNALYRSPGQSDMIMRPIQDLVQMQDLAALIARGRVVALPPAPLFEAHDEQDREQAVTMHQSFQRPPVGDAAERFYNHLETYDDAYRTSERYGRSIAILQSSGTGKSKLMRDLSDWTPSITLCLRDPIRNSPTSGWPPCDQPIFEFLLNDTSEPVTAELRTAALLAAIYETITLLLEGCQTKKESLDTLTMHFGLDDPRRPQLSQRHESFVAVASRARQILSDTLTSGRLHSALGTAHTNRVTMLKHANDPEKLELSYHVVHASTIYKHVCYTSALALGRALDRLGHKHFVLGFDECRHLQSQEQVERPLDVLRGYDAATAPYSWMSLAAVQRLIKAADEHPITARASFWCTFLDTSSSVFLLVPRSGPDLHSERLQTLYSLPSYHYLPFDVMKPNTLSSNPQVAMELEKLKPYGRPLWQTVRRGSVLRAAIAKLFAGRFDPSNTDHVLAAFSHRVLLELSHGEASSRLALKAVRSHMRILISVADRRRVLSRVPSEPMLSLAAMHALHTSPQVPDDDRPYSIALRTLAQNIILDAQIIEPGRLGELMARLYLVIARDAILGSNFLENTDNGHRVRPVNLASFLEVLLGKDNLDEDLLRSASRKHINFTHFCQIPGSIDDVTPEFLHRAWDRGIALQCQFNQAVLDFAIVSYGGPLSKPWDDKHLGTVSGQIKFKSKAAEASIVRGLVGPLINGNRPNDEVAILMDMGMTTKFGSSNRLVECTYEPAVRPGPSKTNHNWAGYLSDGKSEPNRWCINVRGHDSKSYPAVSEFYHDAGFVHVFESTFGYLDPIAKDMASEFVDTLWAGMDAL